jgi:hypothetical protein
MSAGNDAKGTHCSLLVARNVISDEDMKAALSASAKREIKPRE